MQVSQISLDATRATLGAVALFQALAALTSAMQGKCANATKANAIGATVCAIATSVYQRMKSSSGRDVEDLRHADWLVTCPLMLWELYALMQIDIKNHAHSFAFSVVSIVLCILLGRAAADATGATRGGLFLLATVLFVAMLVNIGLSVDWTHSHSATPFAFLSVWALYPFAFWEQSGTAYNVLDLVSKGVFGMYVGSLVF